MTDIAHHPIPSHPIPPTHVHANLYLLTHLPTTDLYDAATLLSRGVSKLAFLPISHAAALSTYASSLLTPSSSSPPHALHASLLSLQSTIQAVLAALGRPPQLAAQAAAARRAADRGRRALAQSTRWPLGLLDDTRQRLNEDRADRARRAADDADAIAKELRYTQQVVAAELAGWQDLHERLGRRALREYARGMLVLERERLAGLRRAGRMLFRRGDGGGWSQGQGQGQGAAGGQYQGQNGKGAEVGIGDDADADAGRRHGGRGGGGGNSESPIGTTSPGMIIGDVDEDEDGAGTGGPTTGEDGGDGGGSSSASSSPGSPIAADVDVESPGSTITTTTASTDDATATDNQS